MKKTVSTNPESVSSLDADAEAASLLSDHLIRAAQEAVRAALREHKLAGNPIAVWKDGKVVIIPPEEIDV